MRHNALDFQKSITEELNFIRNRVRHLIGNRHYGEDGRYKEAILKNIVKRFLPANISIGTGFIVNADTYLVSRQLDVIVYDNRHPVLFSEGDFIITTPNNVKAVIEVKSRITSASLGEVIERFDESIHGIFHIKPLTKAEMMTGARKRIEQKTDLFLGVFAFEFEGSIQSRHDAVFKNSRKYINHIALGTDTFIRKWKKEEGKCLAPEVEAESDFYNVYHLQTLAFSYFISNLIDIVSGGLNDRYWFAFPIENTKESRRVRTVFV